MGRRILLVAGGTGGHIWPAISFGRWIEKNKNGAVVKYACGRRPLELEIYGAAGIAPEAIGMEGSPFSGSGIKRLSRTCDIFPAMRAARSLLKSFAPDVCVMFGGYVSFPFLAACRLCGVNAVMHEQNARAGKVTRLAAKIGIDVFSGWPQCEPLKSREYTCIGVPVRDFENMSCDEAWKRLKLPGDVPSGPKAVVFTGSLGSAHVMDMICEIALVEPFNSWTFILPAVSNEAERRGDNVWLLPKVWDASPLFRLANMAVVRAGGSTLTETGTMGIPSIVVPWRGAADDHQYYNALAFVAENRAIMWDGCDKGEFLNKLRELSLIAENNNTISSFRLYNSAGRICEDLWLAVSPEA